MAVIRGQCHHNFILHVIIHLERARTCNSRMERFLWATQYCNNLLATVLYYNYFGQWNEIDNGKEGES